MDFDAIIDTNRYLPPPLALYSTKNNRQAYATRDDLDRQRSTLLSVNQRINNVATQLPSVGQLIGKIQSRKNRDNVILSCVIGSCVVGVLYLVM